MFVIVGPQGCMDLHTLKATACNHLGCCLLGSGPHLFKLTVAACEFSLVASSWGLSLVVVLRLFLVLTSLVVEHGL